MHVWNAVLGRTVFNRCLFVQYWTPQDVSGHPRDEQLEVSMVSLDPAWLSQTLALVEPYYNALGVIKACKSVPDFNWSSFTPAKLPACAKPRVTITALVSETLSRAEAVPVLSEDSISSASSTEGIAPNAEHIANFFLTNACVIANMFTQTGATATELAADKVVLVRLLTEYAPALANMFAQVKQMQTTPATNTASKRKLAPGTKRPAAVRPALGANTTRKRVPLCMIYGDDADVTAPASNTG